MPALDPYAAFARPIINFDQQPSAPLQFAQTLLPRDPNKPSPKHDQAEWTPRVKERETLPRRLPPQPYAHAKHASLDFDTLDSASGRLIEGAVGSDEWMQRMVAQNLDSANRNMDIS